jgi:hypothetical protein
MKLFSAVVPYLLLVSFATPQFSNLSDHHMKTIASSPYHGIAVRLSGVNDAGNHSYEGYSRQYNILKKYPDKKIWPWIFFNRFIGYEGTDYKKEKKEAKRHFMQIKGMDIYDKTKDLEAFYLQWSAALKIAKSLNSPGIVVDVESYNNPKAYSVAYLAKLNNVSENEVVSQLLSIGRHLANLAQESYPASTLWFLFTGLDRLDKPEKDRVLSVAYIVVGLLDEVRNKKYNLTVVSGGELSLNYCSNSIQDLNNKIDTRRANYSSLLHKNPALRLGGTIAPWNDLDLARKRFIRKICPKATMARVGDFKPMLEKLMITYDYVWIYAATSMQFEPFDPLIAKPFHEIIGEALSLARQNR